MGVCVGKCKDPGGIAFGTVPYGRRGTAVVSAAASQPERFEPAHHPWPLCILLAVSVFQSVCSFSWTDALGNARVDHLEQKQADNKSLF